MDTKKMKAKLANAERHLKKADDHHAVSPIGSLIFAIDELSTIIEGLIEEEEYRQSKLPQLPEMVNDWNTLITAWKEGREPEANPEHWECKYCPYFKSCGAALLIV